MGKLKRGGWLSDGVHLGAAAFTTAMVCCCSSCAAPSKKHQFCWSFLTLFGAAAVLATSVWTLSLSNDIKDTTMCMFDSYQALAAAPPPGINMTAGEDAMAEVSPTTIDNVERALDWWATGMITPGAVFFGVLFFAVLFSCMSIALSDGCCAPTTSKLCITIGTFASLTAIGFFALCAVAGIAAASSNAQNTWHENVERPCDDMVDEMNAQLASANATLQSCYDSPWTTPADCQPYQRDFDYAVMQMGSFEAFCQCAGDWLSKASPLGTPGIIGVLLSITGLFFSWSLCRTMACCGSYASAMEEAEKDFDGVQIGK